MKHLQLINEPELRGFSLITNKKQAKIHVNIELLWNSAKVRAPKNTIDKFIKDFCATYIHEVLHCVIRKNYRPHPKYEYGEEQMVWLMLNEKMPKYIKQYYDYDCNYTRGVFKGRKLETNAYLMNIPICLKHVEKKYIKLPESEREKYAGYCKLTTGGRWRVTALFEGEDYTTDDQNVAEIIANQEQIKGLLMLNHFKRKH